MTREWRELLEAELAPYEAESTLQGYRARLADQQATTARGVLLDLAVQYGCLDGLLGDTMIGTQDKREDVKNSLMGVRTLIYLVMVPVTLLLYLAVSVGFHHFMPWWVAVLLFLMVIGNGPAFNSWFESIKGTRVDVFVHWGILLALVGFGLLIPSVLYRGLLIPGVINGYQWQPIPYTIDQDTPYLLTTPAFNLLIAQGVDASNVQAVMPNLNVQQTSGFLEGWLQNLAITSSFQDIKLLQVPTLPGASTWFNVALLCLPFVSGLYLWGLALLLMGVGMLYRYPGNVIKGIYVLMNWGGLVFLLAVIDAFWPVFF